MPGFLEEKREKKFLKSFVNYGKNYLLIRYLQNLSNEFNTLHEYYMLLIYNKYATQMIVTKSY